MMHVTDSYVNGKVYCRSGFANERPVVHVTRHIELMRPKVDAVFSAMHDLLASKFSLAKAKEAIK